jgi:hypothetical protein
VSKFLSGDHIDIDDGLGIYIKVFQDREEYLSTFFLSIPDRDTSLEEFQALILGLSEAKYKIEQLLEIFEDGLDS